MDHAAPKAAPSSFKKNLIIALGVAASLAILSAMIFRDAAGLLEVGSRIHWKWMVLALACAAGSYMMVGMALREVLLILGYRLSFAEVMGIALVSSTVNYFISTLGVSGFALKAHLLRKRRVPYATTLSASVLSSAIIYIVLGVIITQGLIYLMLHFQGTKIAIMESALGLLVLIAVTVPMLVFFFNQDIRGKVTSYAFLWADRAVYLFSKSEIPPEDFAHFEAQLSRGLERVRTDVPRLTLVIFYTCLDWSFAMTTLYFAFRAVGVGLSVGFLSAGFTAGQAAALIPVLPGGLGAVEGSMSAVFGSLGIDWETAFVAVLLYRFVYYAIPTVVSVFVMWGLKVSEPVLAADTLRESSEPEDPYQGQ